MITTSNMSLANRPDATESSLQDEPFGGQEHLLPPVRMQREFRGRVPLRGLCFHGRAARRYSQGCEAVAGGAPCKSCARRAFACVLWRLLPSPPPAGHGTAVKLAGAWRPRQAPHFVRSLGSCCGASCRKCRQPPKGTVARGATRRPWLGSCRRKVGTTPARRGHAEPNSLGGVLRQGVLARLLNY